MTTSHRFCVAPMMDWTDRHDRFFLRQMSRHMRLYTEMVTADAVLHGARDYLLGFDPVEHPVALQLGGSDPDKLAQAAVIGADYGYDEINLNVGCPSDRVQSGRFGACLMREPELVASCLAAMRDRVKIDVTLKCRLGVDDQDPEEALYTLVEAAHRVGIRHFIIHARKAWLDGLSPKENRDIPPLDYDIVYRLKQRYADCVVVINGGITTLDEAATHLEKLDGVMMGRAAYKNPYQLAEVDQLLYGVTREKISREEVLVALIPYAEALCARGVPLHALTRHILGLYQNCPRARLYRRFLSEQASKSMATADLLREVLDFMAAAPKQDDASRLPAASVVSLG
jgi:tRNA-dihydrouridine synthase A